MGRDRGPKHKLSRREGVDLFGTGGASLARRIARPPGASTRRRRTRESDYSHQLREKQKVKRMYGLREKQFLRVVSAATRAKEPTGEAILNLLERRLDNVVYRLGFARSRPQARQFVTHRHVLVDGSILNVPSARLQPGQTVSLSEDARSIPDVEELKESHPEVPRWLSRQDFSGRVMRLPERDDAEALIDEQLVIQFYSRR